MVKIKRTTTNLKFGADEKQREQIVSQIRTCDVEGEITLSRLAKYVFDKSGWNGVVFEGPASAIGHLWHETYHIDEEGYHFLCFE